MQLGAEKEADVSCHTSTDNELAMCSVPPVWWLWGWWKQWRRGSRGKFKPEQCLALLKCTWLMMLLNNFFYMHSTDKHNIQNILNLEMVLFHLKCKTSTKQLSVTDLYPEKVICKHMQWSKFFLFIIFYRPKWKIYNFQFLFSLIFVTHLMLSYYCCLH
jgi:hypothetical protein